MRILTLAALAAASLAMTACGTIPLGNDQTGKSWADAAIEIAKDPKCGHTDRIDIDLGVVSKGKVFLERACTQPQPAPVDIAKLVTEAVAKAIAARDGVAQ